MTIPEFETMLRESGVDDTTVKAIIANEKVAARATSLRQGSEYTALETRARDLETSLNGANGKPGAKSYEQWYQNNYAKVVQLQQDAARYQERYGSLDQTTAPSQQQATFTEADVKKIVEATIQDNYKNNFAPAVVTLATGIGTVVERHMRAGRKGAIDWKELDKLAAATNGDIGAAYDQWDKPNVEADREADIQKRIDAGVKEKLAAAGINRFPAGADAAPSTRSPLSRQDSDKPAAYDRSRMLETFVSGEYKGATQ